MIANTQTTGPRTVRAFLRLRDMPADYPLADVAVAFDRSGFEVLRWEGDGVILGLIDGDLERTRRAAIDLLLSLGYASFAVRTVTRKLWGQSIGGETVRVEIIR